MPRSQMCVTARRCAAALSAPGPLRGPRLLSSALATARHSLARPCRSDSHPHRARRRYSPPPPPPPPPPLSASKGQSAAGLVRALPRRQQPHPPVVDAEADPRATARAAASAPSTLVDPFGRPHTYLRLSVTERCNLRCTYCMPDEGVSLTPSPSLLTTPEIIRLVSIFASRGVTKVRLTGGEPLVRPDLVDIAHAIGHHPDVETLAITTNALVLKRHIPALRAARVSALNISLDTLVAPKFSLIARRNGHGNVLDGLHAALDAGFPSVKLNVVVMRGVNDEELGDFCDMTRHHALDVRFIEFMPFQGNRWTDARFMSYADMLRAIAQHCGALERATDAQNDTCKHYRIPGAPGRVGFITSMTDHFCGTCNRLRVTADGSIKVCLFGAEELSLRDVMRRGSSDEEVAATVAKALAGKHFALGGNRDMYEIAQNDNRSMIRIGG